MQNDETLSNIMMIIFSLFTLVYGNLTVSAISKKNVKFVEDNPFVFYLIIFIHSLFFTSMSYKGKISQNMIKIILLSILLFITILLIIYAHPYITLFIITIILVGYLYLLNKNKNISGDIFV